MARPKVIIFASGTKDGGGSGVANLVRCAEDPDHPLDAEIVAFVSNHESGGVRRRADELDIRFIHFPGPYNSEHYQEIIERAGAEWIALSGWLKLVRGLDPRRTINIHPGPLSTLGTDGMPKYGGDGMYGRHVHEAVLSDFDGGLVKNSAVSMHFVTEEYDKGPLFFEFPVSIYKGDTVETLQARVNKCEHEWQPVITQMVISGQISWDGRVPKSLAVLEDYPHLPTAA